MRARLATVDARTGVVILKRLWDETALRLQCSEEVLKFIVGDELGEQVLERESQGGRGSTYPGFVVQSMQQAGFLRWGRSKESGCDFIPPMKLMCSTSAVSIWNALCAGPGCLSPEELHRLSQRVRALVLYKFPDGLPGNRVVMQQVSEMLPFAIRVKGHCVAHLLQIVWDAGCQGRVANPLYQLTQLMGHAGSNVKVQRATVSQADDGEILAGVDPGDCSFTKFVLDYTARRQIFAQSFFTEPGGRRHDAAAHQKMKDDLEKTCSDLTVGLNMPWNRPKCGHGCWGLLPGNRCCTSNAVARQKLRGSLDTLSKYILTSLKDLAANKWRSISDCLSKVGLGVLAHQCLGRAFGRTLATKDELERLRVLILQDAAPDAAHADGVNPLPIAILHGKRVLGTHAFLERADTQFLVLSFLVAALPIY